MPGSLVPHLSRSQAEPDQERCQTGAPQSDHDFQEFVTIEGDLNITFYQPDQALSSRDEPPNQKSGDHADARPPEGGRATLSSPEPSEEVSLHERCRQG